MTFKMGDVTEIQGSAKLPYKIKWTGEVISCDCVAWKMQSQPINKRTCRHIRKLRGDEAESARIGGSLTMRAPKRKDKVTAVAPALLLAETWSPEIDPTGYWMSEKLDGVRAYWDGTKFLSRLGNEFFAPAWYKKHLPKYPLDGEFWMGRKMFQKTVSIVRTEGLDKEWRGIMYRVFDLPAMKKAFEQRMEAFYALNSKWFGVADHLGSVNHVRCEGIKHLRSELGRIEALGGEGLMLRLPLSIYEGCRSETLLKVKTLVDAEARILSYEDGKKGGNREHMVGAFWVQAVNGDLMGKKFKVGTGQTHELLKNPPPIGSLITFRYVKSAVSDDGLPKPASYVGPAIDK
jgi:DNA ligase-1